MQSTRSAKNFLFILAIIKLIVPFFLQNSFYQPHRDEYLYLAEAHHMDWGYMEIPPLLSVFAWITNFFGAGMFWIRIWPALFGALTFLLVGKIILSLGGRTFALFLGWLPFMIDGYMRLFFLFMPNFLDVFFWKEMTAYIQHHSAITKPGIISDVSTGNSEFNIFRLFVSVIFWWNKLHQSLHSIKKSFRRIGRKDNFFRCNL